MDSVPFFPLDFAVHVAGKLIHFVVFIWQRQGRPQSPTGPSFVRRPPEKIGTVATADLTAMLVRLFGVLCARPRCRRPVADGSDADAAAAGGDGEAAGLAQRGDEELRQFRGLAEGRRNYRGCERLELLLATDADYRAPKHVSLR